MIVVVCGWVAPFPSAGMLWHYANYLLGFLRLGHDVYYVEDSGDHPWGWDHDANDLDLECRFGSRFLACELDALGFGDRWVFRHVPTGRHDGLDAATTADLLHAADLLVNVSCSVPRRPEYERVPLRLAIDTDPVFTQIKVAEGRPHWGGVPEWHTRLLTFGRPPLPAQQHTWLPTRQPVCTEAWRALPAAPPGAAFTTVAAWQSYPPLVWSGRAYEAKDRSLSALRDLPRRAPAPVRMFLGPGPREEDGRRRLASWGWEVVDGNVATRGTNAYRELIGASAGEIGVAKHGYVAAQSGWFSERTCCYLASGRPAVVQDTGWSQWLEPADGLLPFRTTDEAVRAIEAVMASPDKHATGARAVAEQSFDAAAVCAELLELSE